jgi:hypothetical protein
MRTLTSSEAEVTAAPLARNSGGDRELIRRTGVPRTTLQRVRRTALREGWLVRAEIPNPARAGIERVQFWLIQPYAEFHPAATLEWAGRDDVVALWDLGESFLAVTSSPRPGGSSQSWALGGRSSPDWVRSARTVSVGADEGRCPAFFDFEGVWSRAVLDRAPRSYPRGLEFQTREPRLPVPPGSERALARLLSKHSPNGGAPALSPPWVALRERRWRRTLIDAGWLESRFVLCPWSLPGVPALPSPSLVFVLGRRRPIGTALSAFSQLREVAGVHPFLYAEDSERVILGAMAVGGRASRPNSVLATAKAYLQNLEIVRAPLDRVRMPAPFRFVSPTRDE